MKYIAAFFFFFVLMNPMFSQVKFEKEYRLKENEVSKKAVAYTSMFGFKKDVKWYGEESQDGKSIEAKGKVNKHTYSVEFTTDGNLIDIEKRIAFKELDKNEQILINNLLCTSFIKFSIKKVQLQFTDIDKNDINKLTAGLITNYNYEIVVKGKKKSTYHLYEFLISKKGKILKELKFSSVNTDNLEF